MVHHTYPFVHFVVKVPMKSIPFGSLRVTSFNTSKSHPSFDPESLNRYIFHSFCIFAYHSIHFILHIIAYINPCFSKMRNMGGVVEAYASQPLRLKFKSCFPPFLIFVFYCYFSTFQFFSFYILFVSLLTY